MPLLTVSWVHLLTPSSQHAIVSPSAAYRAVRNSTQSVDSSPPTKRQRSLKVELVVSSPCHQIRGPRAAGDGARFPFQLALPAGISVRTDQPAPGARLPWHKWARRAFARWSSGIQLASASVRLPIREGRDVNKGLPGDCPTRPAFTPLELYENQAKADRFSGPPISA